MRRILILLFSSLFIISCDSGVEWKDGNYEVQWIDTYKNIKLGYVLEDGFWIPRIGKTIKAIGSDAHYIVVKKYDADSSSIQFYYIIKNLDKVKTDLSPAIMGPYDIEEFLELTFSKNLPSLSVEFL